MPMIEPRDALAGFIVLLLIGHVVIRLWGDRQDRRARAAAIERARAALLDSPATTYGAGAHAALDGAQVWMNPYASPGNSNERAMAWHCGWCYGQQLLLNAGVRP